MAIQTTCYVGDMREEKGAYRGLYHQRLAGMGAEAPLGVGGRVAQAVPMGPGRAVDSGVGEDIQDPALPLLGRGALLGSQGRQQGAVSTGPLLLVVERVGAWVVQPVKAGNWRLHVAQLLSLLCVCIS